MNDRLIRLIFWVLTLVLCFAQGCVLSKQKLAVGPNEKTVFSSDFADKAFDAAGGKDSWEQTEKISLNGIVTVYNPDGSFYLTKHRYLVYPWSNSIDIVFTEPKAKLSTLLSGGIYSIEEKNAEPRYIFGPPFCEKITKGKTVCDFYFSQALLDIITAPVRFTEDFSPLQQPNQLVRVDSSWAYPYKCPEKLILPDAKEKNVKLPKPYKPERIFYQTKEKGLVSMIAVIGSGSENRLMVRGYDYIKTGKVLIPSKIEIFQLDSAGNIGARLVKINFIL